jgi:TPR repeat protein
MKLKIILCVLITSLFAYAQTNTPVIATNSVTTISIIRKAAEQNDAEAQCKLGNCYRRGEGMAKDYIEAANWYRKAA